MVHVKYCNEFAFKYLVININIAEFKRQHQIKVYPSFVDNEVKVKLN